MKYVMRTKGTYLSPQGTFTPDTSLIVNLDMTAVIVQSPTRAEIHMIDGSTVFPDLPFDTIVEMIEKLGQGRRVEPITIGKGSD